MRHIEMKHLGKKQIFLSLVFFYALYKYTPEIGEKLQHWGYPQEFWEPWRALIQLIFIVFSYVFLFYLCLPATQIIKSLSNINDDELKSNLDKAKEYSSELIRRLLKAVPVEGLLISLAGAESKHITTIEDKVRFKTVGIIMILIFIYAFVSVNYLMSIGGDNFYTILSGAQNNASPYNELTTNDEIKSSTKQKEELIKKPTTEVEKPTDKTIIKNIEKILI